MGKDYTELYDEIGDKVTIDDVQEDPTTGLAYVEYEGKTYELGMDFLSMAMVYKTAVPENSQYETEDDVYAALVEVLHDPVGTISSRRSPSTATSTTMFTTHRSRALTSIRRTRTGARQRL